MGIGLRFATAGHLCFWRLGPWGSANQPQVALPAACPRPPGIQASLLLVGRPDSHLCLGSAGLAGDKPRGPPTGRCRLAILPRLRFGSGAAHDDPGGFIRPSRALLAVAG